MFARLASVLIPKTDTCEFCGRPKDEDGLCTQYADARKVRVEKKPEEKVEAS